VSGGPAVVDQAQQTRHPGFTSCPTPPASTRSGHIYKDGPADRDYLKIKEGLLRVAVDDHDLKTTDNYWRTSRSRPARSSTSWINDKPAKDGPWDVTISPIAAGAFGDLQYAKWVSDRRDIVTKASNGEIGYLHIRAMDAPSLRQFQLDLAANRTKKALVIDQRFNGGGGIDQELLGILAGRQYQYTLGRDAGVQMSRPQNFYGPMVVMQNERSASDAEMFPPASRRSASARWSACRRWARSSGRVVHAARRLGDPHAGQRRVDVNRPEHGELRRPAGRLRRQHADDFIARERDAQVEEGRSKC
jgi:tricorn protease